MNEQHIKDNHFYTPNGLKIRIAPDFIYENCADSTMYLLGKVMEAPGNFYSLLFNLYYIYLLFNTRESTLFFSVAAISLLVLTILFTLYILDMFTQRSVIINTLYAFFCPLLNFLSNLPGYIILILLAIIFYKQWLITVLYIILKLLSQLYFVWLCKLTKYYSMKKYNVPYGDAEINAFVFLRNFYKKATTTDALIKLYGDWCVENNLSFIYNKI